MLICFSAFYSTIWCDICYDENTLKQFKTLILCTFPNKLLDEFIPASFRASLLARVAFCGTRSLPGNWNLESYQRAHNSCSWCIFNINYRRETEIKQKAARAARCCLRPCWKWVFLRGFFRFCFWSTLFADITRFIKLRLQCNKLYRFSALGEMWGDFFLLLIQNQGNI